MTDYFIEELNAWFKNRPGWMQEAAGLLLTKRHVAEKDIVGLLDKCLQEVDLGDPASSAPFSADIFLAQGASALCLCAIGNVKGINALAPRKSLDFGSGNLTVVYGGNGSGKSGYVRILKHVCGARNPGALHPNVFEDDRTTQSAEIKYSIDNQDRQVSWSADDEVQADLRSVDIFDADCGRMYLEKESEVKYEPPELLFFSDLIAVCEQVSRHINDKLEKCVSKKPKIPSEYTNTVIGKWYESLSATTTSDEISIHTKWESDNDKYICDLEMRLEEKAPTDRAKELLVKKGHAENLIQNIESLISKLSDANCGRILELKKDKLIKHEAAKAAATKVFSGAPLEGIGTEAWKLLWNHARQYSEEYAYRGQIFPNLAPEARCVLCHQPLSDEARQRFASFEEYIKGQAERDAKCAE